jgi:competence protein ComEC
MFWAASAYAAGIVMASLAWRPMSWWLVGGFASILFCGYFLKTRAVFAAALATTAFLCLGAFHYESGAASAAPGPDLTQSADGEEVVVTAHVVRTGLPRSPAGASDPRLQERREVIDVETETIEGAWGRRELAVGLRVTVRSKDIVDPDARAADASSFPATSFVYGERIRFAAKLREPRNYGNPGAMDYRAYLRGKGIYALASVSVEKFEKLEGFSGSAWGRLRSQARNRVAEAMLTAGDSGKSSWLRLNREDAALLLAMVIGEQSLLERTTRTDFQRTGVFHILVVSGMNVGVLALFVFWMARKLRARAWVATWLTVTLCLAYVAITDLGTPVLRAAIMLCIYLVARMLYRDRFSLNAVGLAAWILLLAAPDAVFEPSFQLTFLSMVALSGIVQPLLEATSRPYQAALRGLELIAYDLTLPPKLAQFRLDLRLIAEKITRLLAGRPNSRRQKIVSWLLTSSLGAGLTLYDLVVVSIVMQVALALPMTLYFHRLALLGVPTNILVVPLTAVLLPAALIATLVQFFSATLATAFWSVSALCLHAITFVVQQASGIRFAEVRLGIPELATSVIAAALFVVATIVARRGRWGAWSAAAALLIGAAVMIIPPTPRLSPNVMEMTTIDVGQGDSILLVTPEGKTMLIDGGGPAGPFRTDNFDIGEDVVSPYLWSRGITRLDVVVVTHAHSDHLAGMPAIIANFRPREMWLGTDGAGYERLKAAATQYGVPIKYYAAGDTAKLGSVKFSVLNPPRDFAATLRRNEDSLVLQARYGETSVLLTGDAERKTEERLEPAPASLLKVAHHGSGTSTTPELLAKTKPQYAVISAGYRNLYGHPRADVLSRLREAHVRTYRTDIQGVVTFYLDGKTITAAPR